MRRLPVLLTLLLVFPLGLNAGVYEITYTGEDLMDQARFPIQSDQ